MDEEEPREYDRDYTDQLSDVTQVRLGYSHDRGNVTRFVLQLEYCLDGEWREVVRYDHDPASEFGHDVTEEGLHIDVYRDGDQYRTEYVAPPMPAGLALDRAEDHLIRSCVTNFSSLGEHRCFGLRRQPSVSCERKALPTTV